VSDYGAIYNDTYRDEYHSDKYGGQQPSGGNFKRLKEHILSLSHADDWELAVKEWQLIGVFRSDPTSCPCGQRPIVELCWLRNRVTRHETYVGNVCVDRFLGIDARLIFAAIRRITDDIEKSLNDDAIVFFRERGLLTRWEYTFLEDTRLKRNLSGKQLDQRVRINKKVLAAIKRRGFRGPD
jgi:hypothetical protein